MSPPGGGDIGHVTAGARRVAERQAQAQEELPGETSEMRIKGDREQRKRRPRRARDVIENSVDVDGRQKLTHRSTSTQ